MEAFSALLAICAGNSPVTGEFSTQRPVSQSFDVFFDLRLIKRLSKQSRGWWFETPSCSLRRHCNEFAGFTEYPNTSFQENISEINIVWGQIHHLVLCGCNELSHCRWSMDYIKNMGCNLKSSDNLARLHRLGQLWDQETDFFFNMSYINICGRVNLKDVFSFALNMYYNILRTKNRMLLAQIYIITYMRFTIGKHFMIIPNAHSGRFQYLSRSWGRGVSVHRSQQYYSHYKEKNVSQPWELLHPKRQFICIETGRRLLLSPWVYSINLFRKSINYREQSCHTCIHVYLWMHRKIQKSVSVILI